MRILDGKFTLPTLADALRSVTGLVRPSTSEPDTTISEEALLRRAERLLTEQDEASSLALSLSILRSYKELDRDARRSWLLGVARRFGSDLSALKRAAEAFLADPGETTAARLQKIAEPRRQELLRRLNHVPGATHALVRMREDIMGASKGNPSLAALEDDFVHLFSSWFNRGFLQLRRIDWTTPATVLEKIIQYEAVHAIPDWSELRRRIDPPDRRLYAFFHPALGDEPLIFVEVALTTIIPDAIAPLLAADRSPIDAATATTAVFYSISNAQRGLSGVAFGDFLIKQVVKELQRELPRLTRFCTLSPIPGFAHWLQREAANPESVLITKQARRQLALLERPSWIHKPAAAAHVNRALLALVAHYFVTARDKSGRIVDPVARFHLGNGARLERINALGDRSASGLRQSHGLMVNYLYELEAVATNREAFIERRQVATSADIRRLASTLPRPADRGPNTKGSRIS